jgi:hypothetical protein
MTAATVVLTLAESDYLYGTGAITIRVRHVHRERPITYGGDTWYEIDGAQLDFANRELGQRTVLVRAARLRRTATAAAQNTPPAPPP